jgi:hypothetical protein
MRANPPWSLKPPHDAALQRQVRCALVTVA